MLPALSFFSLLATALFIPGAVATGDLLPRLAAVVCGALLLASVSAQVHDAVRRRSLREVHITPEGMELITHPTRWFKGGRTSIAWDDVEMISAEHVLVKEKRARSTVTVAREGLDFYLFRDIDSPSDIAATAIINDSPLQTMTTPVFRIRVAGRGDQMAAAVREIARAIDAVRPDLFYRGTSVDQWYTAPPAAEEESATIPGGAGQLAMVRAAPSTSEAATASTTPNAVPGPLWLDFRTPRKLRWVMFIAGVPLPVLSWVLLRFVAGLLDPLPTLGVSIIAISGFVVLSALVIVGLVAAVLLVATLPSALAREGILVDAEGLVLAMRRGGSPHRVIQHRIPWSDVQAIIGRNAAAVKIANMNNHAQQRPATDIYLRGDAAVQYAEVGSSPLISKELKPDSAATRDLVSFPAVRLRIAQPVKAAKRFADPWRDIPTEGPGPHRLPGWQLRAALHALRPDLCHGFTDEDVAPDREGTSTPGRRGPGPRRSGPPKPKARGA